MDSKLKKIIDYAKFSKNENLNELVNELDDTYGKKLSLDDLDELAAARGSVAGVRTDDIAQGVNPYQIGKKFTVNQGGKSNIC